MKRIAGNTLTVLAIVFVPLFLGALIVGPDVPVGRNTRSATRVGHKALFLLYRELGYEVRRFERGVETLPNQRAVLVALEPGPSLFREKGLFASGLLRWIERGNAALVTLGPDPDRPAELDDDEGELGAHAERAIEIAESIADRARERAGAKSAEEREREEHDPAAAAFREEREASDSWDPSDLTVFLELPLLEDRLKSSRTSSIALTGPLAARIGEDASLKVTRPRVWAGPAVRVLTAANGRPLLIEKEIGAGRLFLLSEPRLFHNVAIARASHAQLAVRTIEELASSAGTNVILFEEFSHGGREASSIIDVAIDTRARWLVLQLLLAALIWILMVARRSRSIVPFESPPRRSRDEAIDAMASLFLRASDTRGAASRLIELSRLRLTRTIPAGGEAELVRLLAMRLQREPAELDAVLDPETVRSAKDLVERAEALRALRVAADDQKW